MGTKQHEVNLMLEGKGCLGKAMPDEPIFILRAQDALAAGLVELWASQAAASGCPVEKVKEALSLAASMRAWPAHKNPD